MVTSRNFPAAIAGLAANVVLLLVLVPALGLAGAGLALCGAYVVMLGIMHLLTRRAFPVAFEWRRLVHLTVIVGGLAAAGELLLPTSGAVGFVSRAVVWAVIPGALLVTGFAHGAELAQARELLARLRPPGSSRPAPGES
jgi:peptidoglycan biosynthesis protein MviN/MurJ (putative lipid II flippase)